MKSAILGLEGGNGAICFLAWATASTSNPANTVVIRSGVLLCVMADFTPGRQFPAAHPHTELITTKAVPSDFTAPSTSAGVRSSVIPAEVNSCFIGITISGGYISCFSLNNVPQRYRLCQPKTHTFVQRHPS